MKMKCFRIVNTLNVQYEKKKLSYLSFLKKYLATSSPNFEEFLQFLGEKIRLKGWDKYRGGLDIKCNS